MEELRSQLDPKIAQALDETLEGQTRESLSWVRELDSHLTRTNFLTNGGAAIATLAFLGSEVAPPEIAWPLAFFTAGTVATGIEVRALLSYFAVLHKDATRRRRGFMNDELRVKDLHVPADIAKWPKHVNQWSGLFSQLCFVLGVVVAACALWPDA